MTYNLAGIDPLSADDTRSDDDTRSGDDTTPGSGPMPADFRSDTVTRPTPAMRAAMAAAAVGDDVYGDDPTVNALESRVAAMLGKEAGLFVASGTQSNLVAVLTHCQRGHELLVGDKYHIYRHEAGGASVLGGVMIEAVPTDDRGALNPDRVVTAVKPDDLHCPITHLLCLENTVNGYVHDGAAINRLATAGRASGLVVHLDGARLMNAAVRLAVPPAALVSSVDSVSLCLSKGLGAPAGSVLVGPVSFIRQARRLRKMLGGGMRQAGILAAAGLFALDHHIDRLADDHDLARQLAAKLCKIPSITVDPKSVETNMVFMQVPAGSADPLRQHLAANGILLGGGQAVIRLVTHLDVGSDAVNRLICAMDDFYRSSTFR
jgi:threonine aldolase